MNFLHCLTLKLLEVVRDTKTEYTRARHWSLAGCILVLRPHILLGLPIGLFHSGHQIQILYANSHRFHACYVLSCIILLI
jgi:hypothetical protein